MAILHSDSFDSLDVALPYLDRDSTYQADPELVLVRPTLLQSHFLDRFIKRTTTHSASFTPRDTSDEGRLAVLKEVCDYATHLLVFFDGKDPVLRQFLKDPDRPKRPIKLVMV